jgi:hypothetical protein
VSNHFTNVSDAVIFITLFLSSFESRICECLNFSDYSINTLWTGDADLRLYITTVQDG